MTTTVIHWFRYDLRLLDNPALTHACNGVTHLQPVYIHDPEGDATTRWGFTRTGVHRRHFLTAGLADLSQQLSALGSQLLELAGRPIDVLPALARSLNASHLVCEAVAAPEEEAVVIALREAGLRVDTVWQSSMLDPALLPFEARRLPDVFTAFRQSVEHEKVQAAVPLTVPPLAPLPARVPSPGAVMHNGLLNDFAVSTIPQVPVGMSNPGHHFRTLTMTLMTKLATKTATKFTAIFTAGLQRLWRTLPAILNASRSTRTRPRATGCRALITPASCRHGWHPGLFLHAPWMLLLKATKQSRVPMKALTGFGLN